MVFKLETAESKDILEMLWKITYGADGVLNEFPDDIPKEKFPEMLLDEIRKESREEKLATQVQMLDTYGVDLCIKSPVIRDIITLKCYDVLENKQICEIWKIIKLFKTPEDNVNASKRFYGGLITMGFGKEEAIYIKDTCPLYPIALMLERGLNSFEKNKLNSIKEIKPEESKPEELVSVYVPNVNVPNIQKVLTNKDDILEVLSTCTKYEITTTEQFNLKLEELNDMLKSLAKISSVLEKLEKQGISFEYIMSKGMLINELFEIERNL